MKQWNIIKSDLLLADTFSVLEVSEETVILQRNGSYKTGHFSVVSPPLTDQKQSRYNLLNSWGLGIGLTLCVPLQGLCVPTGRSCSWSVFFIYVFISLHFTFLNTVQSMKVLADLGNWWLKRRVITQGCALFGCSSQNGKYHEWKKNPFSTHSKLDKVYLSNT